MLMVSKTASKLSLNKGSNKYRLNFLPILQQNLCFIFEISLVYSEIESQWPSGMSSGSGSGDPSSNPGGVKDMYKLSLLFRVRIYTVVVVQIYTILCVYTKLAIT